MRYSRARDFLSERFQLLWLTSSGVLRLTASIRAIVEQHGVAGNTLRSTECAVSFAVDLDNVQLAAHLMSKLGPYRREFLAVSTPGTSELKARIVSKQRAMGRRT